MKTKKEIGEAMKRLIEKVPAESNDTTIIFSILNSINGTLIDIRDIFNKHFNLKCKCGYYNPSNATNCGHCGAELNS